MRKTKIMFLSCFACALVAVGCNTTTNTAVNTNANKQNTAVLTNTMATPMANASPMANANALPPGATTTVAAIQDNTDAWVGKTVTVVADVEEVWGPRAFTLDEDAPAAGGIDNDIAVISPKAGSLANIDDQWRNNKVKVSGVVHRFVVAEIEREIGWDLDPQIETEIEARRPVIIAKSVERVPAK